MTSFIFFNNSAGVFQAEARKINCSAFCTNRLEALQDMSVEISAQKIKDLNLPVFNIKQNLARKLDPSLKPSNLKELTCLPHFYAQKAHCPRRFREIRP